MTKAELVSQLMDLSVAGYFNGEKFTTKRLNSYLGALCRNDGDKLIMNIALPDGRWYFKITRFGKGDWSYYIPETRDEEQKLIAELMSKASRVHA